MTDEVVNNPCVVRTRSTLGITMFLHAGVAVLIIPNVKGSTYINIIIKNTF